MDPYEALIHELGELINVPIKLNERGNFVLTIDASIDLFIEREPNPDIFRIAAPLQTLAPGAVRLGVLQEALKYNGQEPPRPGTFGYASRTSKLILFEQMRVSETNADSFSDWLETFITSAKTWHEALEAGLMAPGNFNPKERPQPRGFFGLDKS